MSSIIDQGFIDDMALRHLDAAYNLGRWLLGNEHEATDAVHDAYLRAVRAATTYAGGNERAWWLAIVRNCCLARLATRNKTKRDIAIDDAPATAERWLPRSEADDVENRIDSAQRQSLVNRHLQELPLNFREVLILREIEELSYREIADVLEMPIGTVMSRLARGRALLQKALAEHATSQVPHGL
ncbi:sigma-70 family RNA polymerase sigma factor [Rhodanobacter sp. L36]|uniref:sigma-70 family RNA polymerase sigma factor n=1 Tax=Rhodanobacter sp. L36 TaxID=1747221 RepID=UPI00131CED0E|nr:sigma-70 family RNA polymerase sigma factor [Rhodanobacter sp. L36]